MPFMPKKFLTRKEDEIRELDESSYIGITGPKIEIKDVMDVEDRSITFGIKPEQTPTTQWGATKEEIRWALDAAGNTGQYIKYFNLKIDKQSEQIKKLKEIHDRFDREIELLKSYKLEKIGFDKESLAQLDIPKTTELLNQLLLEKRITKSKLQKLKNNITSVEFEVGVQEKEIEQLRKHITASIFNGNDSSVIIKDLEAINTIKEELAHLCKEYDVGKLSKAIEQVILPENSPDGIFQQ